MAGAPEMRAGTRGNGGNGHGRPGREPAGDPGTARNGGPGTHLGGTIAMIRRHGAAFLRHHFGGKPHVLELQITRRCNARCAWCDAWRAPGDAHEAADFSALARRVGPLNVALVGGEPLVRPDLERIVASLRLATEVASVCVSTNALELTAERAKRLREAGVDKLVLSVEGMEDAHDRARRMPGSFRGIVALLPDLVRSGFRAVQLQATVTDRNSADLVPLARLAIDAGVRIAYTLEGPARLGARAAGADDRVLRRLEDELERVVELGDRFECIVSSPAYLRSVVPFLRGESEQLPRCAAGSAFLRATADGWLRPCGAQPRLGHWTAYPFAHRPVACSACWSRRRGENSPSIGAAHLVELYRAHAADRT